MRIKLLITALLIIIIACLLPYRLAARKIQHHQFISFMATQANTVNQNILQQRQRLLRLNTLFQQRGRLSAANWLWLKGLAEEYNVIDNNFKQLQTWQILIKRVDIVPTSLVIAQAINESAWGTSRFARQGNNYFGQRCYTTGCGLVPQRRAADAKFEVRKFADPLLSIQSYMHNLNTFRLYAKFREQRYQLRQRNKTLTGLALVPTLTVYSTKRQTYVKIIVSIINHYHLSQYDDAKLT